MDEVHALVNQYRSFFKNMSEKDFKASTTKDEIVEMLEKIAETNARGNNSLMQKAS